VELEEIEALLAQHEQVRQAAVKVVGDGASGSGRMLVGYYTTEDGSGIEPEVLREFLREYLVAEVIPAALVQLDEFPLSANQKIDRDALPIPELSNNLSSPQPVAPRDQLERELCTIWGEILNVDVDDITADFFRLGGHSLVGTTLVNAINEALGSELPLRILFETPTIAAMADAVRQLEVGSEGLGSASRITEEF
jgi:hypothetical protein